MKNHVHRMISNCTPVAAFSIVISGHRDVKINIKSKIDAGISSDLTTGFYIATGVSTILMAW